MANADTGIKGINLNGLNKMKNAVNDYMTAIKNTPNLGVSAATIAKNMKGTNAQAQVKVLSNNFVNQTKSLINTLSKLNQSLDAVAQGYKSQDQTAGTNIANAAGKLKS